MALILFSGCGRVPAKDLKSFRFSYSTGNMMNASVSYELRFKDGVYTATIKEDGVAEEDAAVYTVDEAFVQKLEAFFCCIHFHVSDISVSDSSDISISSSCKITWKESWPNINDRLLPLSHFIIA